MAKGMYNLVYHIYIIIFKYINKYIHIYIYTYQFLCSIPQWLSHVFTTSNGHKTAIAEESRHQTRPFQGNLTSCGRSEVGAAFGGAAEAQAAASEVGAACRGGSA
jgi:hypothetical protein